jgi:ferrochelatase
MESGSPLKIIMESIANKLGNKVASSREQPVVVEIGMRYGQPSISEGLEKLRAAKVRKLVIFPLYPQYSWTTTGTTFDAVFKTLQKWPRVPDLELISDYHDHPAYINALKARIIAEWKTEGPPQQLLMSFHGIPQRYARNGDPYPQQCKNTAQLLAKLLGLSEQAWSFSYQSRFGPEAWLQPYTDRKLEDYGREGLESLQIIAPGFSVDCLETLEELEVEGRDIFHEAGGGSFRYLPALNDTPLHIDALGAILLEHLSRK